MSETRSKAKSAASAKDPDPTQLAAISEAIESGAGLPAVARAAARALGASIALIDRSSSVLAVAAVSSAEEKKLLSEVDGTSTVELRVADQVVGEMRCRGRGAPADLTMARIISTLVALEVERSRSSDWASDEAAADFVESVLAREITDRGDIAARGSELGAELGGGAGVVVARAHPHAAQAGEWRARVLTLALRGLRAASGSALAASRDGDLAEIVAIVPVTGDDQLRRAASNLLSELSGSLPGFAIAVAHSRLIRDPVDLYRAGKESELAINVAEAEGRSLLAFEDTGAYRLLLPAMSEEPGELKRFYEETVAPLVAYDDQYETELVRTIEAYLENDGNVTPTAEHLFTHRHTIRYRLERVKELSGHDISSTEGREKLSLGLKAMRVLGIASPHGPATEKGAEGGKVRRKEASAD